VIVPRAHAGEDHRGQAMTEAPDQSIVQPFAPKDYLVLLPALASAIALSYDVGCFLMYGVTFMGFFSLTEHLVFALEALPLALALGMGIPVIVKMIGDMPVVRLPSHWASAKWIFLTLIVGALAGISILVGFWTLGAILIIAMMSLSIKSVSAQISSVSLACAVVAMALYLSVAVGVDGANLQKFVSKRQQTITTTSAEFERILLRSGERGILVFDRTSQQTDFLPWDQIRRVSRKEFRPWIYR
jgi:hypothetical protein